MKSFLESYLVTLRLLLDVATDAKALLIMNMVKKDLSSSMILSKKLTELTAAFGLCFNIYLNYHSFCNI